MRLTLLTVSRRPPRWLREACSTYIERLPAEIRFNSVDIAPARRSNSEPRETVRRNEAKAIRSAVAADRLLIPLDETGREMSTQDLAASLRAWIDSDRNVTLVIGGADGLDPSLLADADQAWSLSRLTLQHGIVRLIIVEQIYRAWSLLANHPYHRQ